MKEYNHANARYFITKNGEVIINYDNDTIILHQQFIRSIIRDYHNK